MFFWIASLGLTLLILWLVLRPLFAARDDQPLDAKSFDREVYKDQLAEIKRDLEAGIISKDEANLAEIEISRRLLKSAGDKDADSEIHKAFSALQIAPLAALALVLAIGLYLLVGSPTMPDQPLTSRQADIEAQRRAQVQAQSGARQNAEIQKIVAQAEAHLAQNPEDGRGWDVLAPVYFRMGDFPRAQTAFAKSIELLGSTAMRHASLGETIVNLNDGRVTAEARGHFETALELDANEPRANFFLALALAQDEKVNDAIAAFEDFARRSPADAPWVKAVRSQIALLKKINVEDVELETQSAANSTPSTLNGPTEDDIKAASEMSSEDRTQMIRNMVASLDKKLQDEPDNLEGWQRLIQSYMVLKDQDMAVDALTRALNIFVPETDEGKSLLTLAKKLGVKVPETN